MRFSLVVLAWLVVVLSAFAQDPCWISAAGEPTKGVTSFRRVFVNRGKVVSAHWRGSGLGVFEAFVGGRPVGDDFLKPGFTECGKTRHVYGYDMTTLLDCADGATNVLEATVAPSWWCDEMLTPFPDAPVPWQTGREPAFWGCLELKYVDGRSECVSTGADWQGTHAGPVLEAGIYEGESYDARLRPTDFRPVRLNTEFTGELRPAAARVTLRRDLTLSPVAVSVVKGAEGVTSNAYGTAKVVRRYKAGDVFHLEPGEELVVDFGQNCAAVPEFRFKAKRGTVLTALPGEMLNDADKGVRGCDGPKGSVYRANLRTPQDGMRIVYTFAGQGVETYLPRFTFFGYRYLSLEATDDVDFSTANRGVTVGNYGQMRVASGKTLTIGNKVTLNGELHKAGAGTLAFGAAVEAGTGAKLVVDAGTVQADAATALKDVDVSFADGTALVVDTTKDFGAKGVDLSGVATAARIQLGFAADETEHELAAYPLCTVREGVTVTVARPRRHFLKLSTRSNGDGTVTYLADVGVTGAAIILR